MNQEIERPKPDDLVPTQALRRIFGEAYPMTFLELNQYLAYCSDVDKALACIREGADPCFRDIGSPIRAAGKGCLHGCRNAEVAKLYIDHGADVSSPDAKGATPLHEVYSEAVMRVLLDAGADVLARDKSGRTPLDALRDDVKEDASTNFRSSKGRPQLLAALEAETLKAELQRELSALSPPIPSSPTHAERDESATRRRTRRM